jgi:hypothetical protein
MKLIISRKGFDTGSGGGPSPIVDGRPISLPIPVGRGEGGGVTYDSIGLGDHVRDPQALCHHDPFFHDGRVAFGQAGAAQGHLRNQAVGVGDIFLFFGLFAERGGGEWHHRIFGYLRVCEVIDVATADARPDFASNHAHFANLEWANNTLYVGQGAAAWRASEMLRLTVPLGPVSLWGVPVWLHQKCALSYHRAPSRWLGDNRLQTVARGQEFVTDITDDTEAQAWAEAIIDEIERG